MADALPDHARERDDRNHSRPLCRYPRRPRRTEGHGRHTRTCQCRRPGDAPGRGLCAAPCQHIFETTLSGLSRATARAEPFAVMALDPIPALRSRLDWLGRLEAG